MKRFTCALCVCALALLLLSGAALAAGETLPISQSVSQGAEKTAVTYTLTAANPDAPMPEGAKDGVFTFTLTGKTTDAFPAIAPDRAGSWRYTLSAVGRNAVVTPASVTLIVTAEQTDGALRVTTLAELPSGEKTELKFNVSAQGTPAATPRPTASPRGKTPKTGDDTNLIPYYALAGVSLTLMLVLIARLRREQD